MIDLADGRSLIKRPQVRRGSKTWTLLEAITRDPGMRWSRWAATHWENYSAAGAAVFKLRIRGLVRPARDGDSYGRCWPTPKGRALIRSADDL